MAKFQKKNNIEFIKIVQYTLPFKSLFFILSLYIYSARPHEIFQKVKTVENNDNDVY